MTELIEVFEMLQAKKITVEQAAIALELPVRDLRFRLSRWGDRLPLLLSTLQKIKEGSLARDDAARTLGCSVRQVNYLMETWKVSRPLPQYIVTRTASKVKWELRKKFAIEYIAGQSTIEDAAEAAQVSDRQMRRWVSELLRKHYGMVFKDLKELSERKRMRLADEIETAEGLELAKQNVLKALADGKKTIEEEALERVLSKRGRQNNHV